MQERARQMLRQLLNAPSSLSRNQNFFLFEDPTAARIRRRAAHLRGIRAALLRDDAYVARAHWKGQQLMLRLHFHDGAVQRAWLNQVEAMILKESMVSEASDALKQNMQQWDLQSEQGDC